MLKIRLQRIGRKHEPVFRVVLTDSKNSTKSGRAHEVLGHYDARRGEQAVLKADRVEYWLSKGAQATGTMHNLLISKKIITGKKINVLPKKHPPVKEAEAAAPAPAPAASAPVEAPVETPAETPAPAEDAPAENQGEGTAEVAA